MPVKNSDGIDTYVLVPELFRRLCKIGWCASPSVVKINNYNRLASNELSNYTNKLLPISRVFTRHYVLKKPEDLDATHEYKPHNSSQPLVFETPKVEEWFSKMYGLTTGEIACVEEFLMAHLQAAEGMPSFYNHELLLKAYDHFNSLV
jgi:hypothetical protein